MTIRDQFAMAAMQGILASNCDVVESHEDPTVNQIARASYAIADAMLNDPSRKVNS